MTLAWARYADPQIDFDLFHFITNWNAGGSVTSACRGRWDTRFKSEVSAAPPHADRCEPCERFRINQVQTERGLRELVDNAPRFDTRLRDQMIKFDLGGES